MSNNHTDAQPDQWASRLSDVHTPHLQPQSASQQSGLQEGSPHASPQPGKVSAATDLVLANRAIWQPTTTALPACAEQAGIQRAGDPSSGTKPRPSGLPPEDLALMRQLVAQLAGSQPQASQQPFPQPQQLFAPAQAAPAEAATLPATAMALPAAQQPGMPVDPRPARMRALAQTTPPEAEQELAAGAVHARPGSVQAGIRPAHKFSATLPLAGPQAIPRVQSAEASVAPSAGGARDMRRDKPTSTRPAAAVLLSGQGAGRMPREEGGVPGLEPSPEADAPRSETLTKTTRIHRIPSNVRLPNLGLLGWAPAWPHSPMAEGGSSGVSPPAAAAPSVSAPEAGLLPGAETAFDAGTPTAGPAPAEDPAARAQAVSAADDAINAWLRELPPAVRKEVETVKELVLPLKKLRLLADIDAHLYKFSKRACRRLPGIAGKASPSVPADELQSFAACALVCKRHELQLLHMVLCDQHFRLR